jgi:hypothetical protein
MPLHFGKLLQNKRKKLKNQNRKGKEIRPIQQHIINFLEDQYEISSAAYRSGDLNGICCCRLLLDGTKIFKGILDYLLCYQHNNPDHCPDGEILLNCDLHGQICGVLDSLS